MNKKIIKLFLINTILISILSFENVYAENQCIDTSIGDNITVKYETKYDPLVNKDCMNQSNCTQWEVNNDSKGYYYNLVVSNLSNNMYLEITDDYYTHFQNEEPDIKKITSENFIDSQFVYESSKVFYPVTYTIKIFDANQKCLLKSLNITGPVYNGNTESNSKICSKLKGFKYCKTWLTQKIDNEKFYSEAIKFSNSKNIDISSDLPSKYQELKKEKKNNLKNKKIYAIILLAIIILLITGVLVRRKKQ